MGADENYPEQVGGGPEGLGIILQSSHAGGIYFWGRDVGPDSPDGVGPEHISSHCRATAHQDASKSEGGG